MVAPARFFQPRMNEIFLIRIERIREASLPAVNELCIPASEMLDSFQAMQVRDLPYFWFRI
jgi:hypothetical protein